MTHSRNRLRKYRRAAGLTQRSVAKILELPDKTAISRWESGELVPSIAHLLALSALYSRLVNDLLWPEYIEQSSRIQRWRSEHLAPHR